MKDNNTQPNIPPSVNIGSIVSKAEEIYQKIKNEVEPAQNGKYIAIEPESGEHFIKDTREEAVAESKKKYPDRVPITKRIGELEKASRHISSRARHLRYDRVF